MFGMEHNRVCAGSDQALSTHQNISPFLGVDTADEFGLLVGIVVLEKDCWVFSADDWYFLLVLDEACPPAVLFPELFRSGSEGLAFRVAVVWIFIRWYASAALEGTSMESCLPYH